MGISKEIIFRQVGAKVAYFRKLRGLTQAELGVRIHLSRSSVARIEQGKYNHNVPLSTLIDIAIGLSINISDLVTFTEEEKNMWEEKEE